MLQAEICYVQLQLVNSGMHEPRNSAAALRLVHCAVKRVKVHSSGVSDAVPAVVPAQETTGQLPQVIPQAITRPLLMHQFASEQDPVKGGPQLSAARKDSERCNISSKFIRKPFARSQAKEVGALCRGCCDLDLHLSAYIVVATSQLLRISVCCATR